jgi:hypothetical protein
MTATGRSLKTATDLAPKLDEAGCDFDSARDGRCGGFDSFALNQWSKRYIKVMLARMTDYLEQQSGERSHLHKYLAGGKARFEVEHIWANHYERHKDEFASQTDFADYRDRIGGLLLLPKSFNASYGDALRQEVGALLARIYWPSRCTPSATSIIRSSLPTASAAGFRSGTCAVQEG